MAKTAKKWRGERALTLEELLLQLGLGDLDLDRLVHLLLVAPLVVGIVLDRGREQGVDESCLAQTRLASHLMKKKGQSTPSPERGNGQPQRADSRQQNCQIDLP